MDLQRFIVIGLDPHKTDFAACTFLNIVDATSAVRQYKKLGVTPVLIDLSRVFDFCMVAHLDPQASPFTPVVPTSTNPTTFRLPRWLIVWKQGENDAIFNVGSDLTVATNFSLSLSLQSNDICIVSVNNALILYAIPANTQKLPARVDTDASGLSLDTMSLSPQFTVGILNSGMPEPAINDGVAGLNGYRWNTIVGKFDNITDAFALVKATPSSLIYDYDNDVVWQGPWDTPSTVSTLSTISSYLAFERLCIQEDIVTAIGSNNIGTTVQDLIKILRHSRCSLRRSGQTAMDRANELEASLPQS